MDHTIETLFSRLKEWRPLAAHQDHCAHTFGSAILQAPVVLFFLWLLTLGSWADHQQVTILHPLSGVATQGGTPPTWWHQAQTQARDGERPIKHDPQGKQGSSWTSRSSGRQQCHHVNGSDTGWEDPGTKIYRRSSGLARIQAPPLVRTMTRPSPERSPIAGMGIWPVFAGHVLDWRAAFPRDIAAGPVLAASREGRTELISRAHGADPAMAACETCPPRWGGSAHACGRGGITLMRLGTTRTDLLSTRSREWLHPAVGSSTLKESWPMAPPPTTTASPSPLLWSLAALFRATPEGTLDTLPGR